MCYIGENLHNGIRKISTLSILTLSVIVVFPIFGLDVSVSVIPELTIPLETGSVSLYSIGGGVTAAANLQTLSGPEPLIEAKTLLIPLRGTEKSLTITAGGFGLGYAYFPVPRLKLHAASVAGLFSGSAFTSSRYGLYWSARAEGGYRFSPTLSLLGQVGYSSFLDSPSPTDALFSGLSIGLTLDISLSSASSGSKGVTVTEDQGTKVFPIFYYSYEKSPFGTITLTNNEFADIQDVSVKFSCQGYTSAPVLCGSAAELQRGNSVTFPLTAAFGERVLEITEDAKAQGEITIRYRLLDTWIEKTVSTAISFNHRNAITWKDPAAAAAFASPNDVSVLDLSKYVAGLVRERIRPDIDHALQYGMGLFESMRLMGITYSEDPSAPYRECRIAPNRLDYIQYPYQTFAYNGGDSDDLSLLFISALSSVGLKTAFIPLPDKAYAAFALDASEDETRKFFSDPSRFAWKDGKAWVVVDMTRVREGFLPAWYAGAQAWNNAVTTGNDKYFYPLDSAWSKYKPIGIVGADVAVNKPREDRLRLAFENTMGRFVSSEIDPRVKRMKDEMGVSGGTPRQLNILGILYARYGLLEDAKKAFNQAVEKGSKTSVINLANVDFLLKNYKEAAQLYESILKGDPSNKAALIGLAKARYEMDAYAETDDLYARINQLDPELAAKYSYLSSRIDSGPTRAGSTDEQRETVPWVDGE